MTELGAVVGSPEYMSPEQARGLDDVDASTDIWSICIVLYEAVTGSTPFSATNCNALLRSIVEDDPKPLSQHAAGDDELWQIVERGLHKDRALRYGKISDLGQALASWLVSNGITEDVCGSALDCKWFARKSDPLSLVQGPSVHAPKAQPQAGRKRDSNPASIGMGRGPFTATIGPVSRARTRWLGVAATAGVLLGSLLLALALGRSPSAAVPTARAGAAAIALLAAGPSSTPATALGLPAPAVTANPPTPAPIAQMVVWPGNPAQSEGVTKPPAVAKPAAVAQSPAIAARPLKPSSNASRVNAPVASPAASSAPPIAPKPNRALDLLAPY